MTQDFVETTKEASRGGYQGIKKIRGLLSDLQKVDPNPNFTDTGFGPPKEQIQVKLEDAVVLEVFEGEDEFELKDGAFTFWVPYAVPGKKPGANTIYMKCWVASAEDLGKTPSEVKGEYVTLERKLVTLFKTDKDEKAFPTPSKNSVAHKPEEGLTKSAGPIGQGKISPRQDWRKKKYLLQVIHQMSY